MVCGVDMTGCIKSVERGVRGSRDPRGLELPSSSFLPPAMTPDPTSWAEIVRGEGVWSVEEGGALCGGVWSVSRATDGGSQPVRG